MRHINQVKEAMGENPGAERPAAGAKSEACQLPYIVLIDIHLLPRECLARLLQSERGIAVECYATIDEWLAVGQRACPSLVVLCQTGRSKADAFAEVDRLTQATAAVGEFPAVMLSDNEDPDVIVQMLGKNIRGYVPTSLPLNIALHAMDLARAGGVYVPASSLVAAHRAPEAAATAPKVNGLFTARQAAVVEALRRGKANKIIAYELKMRESTVKVHVRNIMKKLRATNRTEVAFMANRLLNGEELGG